MLPEREADYSTPSNAEVKNGGSYVSTLFLYLTKNNAMKAYGEVDV
jgi:hypothetical protein